MNKLPASTRAQILRCLVEGNSVRATSRLTGVEKRTVTRLLIDAGRACQAYQDRCSDCGGQMHPKLDVYSLLMGLGLFAVLAIAGAWYVLR